MRAGEREEERHLYSSSLVDDALPERVEVRGVPGRNIPPIPLRRIRSREWQFYLDKWQINPYTIKTQGCGSKWKLLGSDPRNNDLREKTGS